MIPVFACRVCGKKPMIEQGWFNIAAMLVPLCKDHFDEYVEFKLEMYRRVEEED